MKNNFSIEELSLLETTEIKGGSASPSEAPQNGCINNVAGCNCTIIIGGPPPLSEALPLQLRRLVVKNHHRLLVNQVGLSMSSLHQKKSVEVS